MYPYQFQKKLQSGQLPKSLMLYGENDYLINQTIDQFIEATQTRTGVLKLYYDEYNFSRAKEHLAQSSLFGDRNLLWIRSDRKIAKNELKQLIALAKRQPTNYLLYHCTAHYTASGFKTLTSLFAPKEAAEHVRFFPPSLKEATQIVQKKAQELSITIDRYGLEHLIYRLDFNLSVAMQELEKLSLLPGPIGTKEIDEHLFAQTPSATDRFFNALFDKKIPLPELLEELYRLHEDETEIIRKIQYFTMQLLQFHLYIKCHGAPDAYAILGYRLPKAVEEKYAALAVRLSPDHLQAILDALAQGELSIKRTGVGSEKETLLLATLIKIKSFFQ